MGVRPILRKLRRQKIKDSKELDEYEEPTDSDSDDDDERFSPEAIQQRFEDFETKFKKHEELLKKFTDAAFCKTATEKDQDKSDDDSDEDEDEDDDEFDDMKEKDNKLLEKLEAIDKKLEEKLAELEYTFGRKGKVLEEEIRDLAEERNSLTETRRKPLY